jgi:hypothetical protein
VSVPQSEMLDELARRAAEEPAAPGATSGDYIPAAEVPPGLDLEVDTLELVADTLELLLGMAAPNWLDESTPEEIRLTRDKIEKLSKVYLALLVKYLPGWIEKYPLEMMAIIQTVLVVKPLIKAGVPMRLPEPEKKSPTPEEKKNATDAAPAPQ